MIRRLLALWFIVGALLTITLPVATAPRDPQRASETKDCTVYVTRTGAKYHTASCSSLRKSRRAMTPSEAIAAGYTPCKRCGGSRCK
jgi:hypothetical protein